MNNIQTGDIIFTRGRSVLAKIIQFIDKCYYNHCGIIYKEGNTWLVLESLNEGATISFLSKRILLNQDYVIYRPVTDINQEDVIYQLVEDVSTCKIAKEYDKWLLIKIGLKRLFNLSWMKSDNKTNYDICSELVRRYTDKLQIPTYTAENMTKLTGSSNITPYDFIRYNEGYLQVIEK